MLLACLPGRGRAGEPDTDEARELLTLLGNQTELATKTGMNADFIPGMATILSGSDMLTRGARTMWEAVSLVPGISQGIEATGERLLLSRGVGHGYASGNIKILLDGMSMNSTLSATANPVLNLPIEQVERIEAIRGPGSSVYGEYAYIGVVNVITRRRERTLHLQGAQEADYGAGGVWYWEDPNLGLTSSVNLVGVQGNGGVQVSEDALFAIGRPELSNAPGPSNEAKRYGALVANAQWSDTFASLSVLDDAYGDHFGINHFLPPSDDQLASRQRYFTGQIGQDWRLSETLSARARIEGMQHQRDRNGLYLFPQDYFGNQPITMDQGYQETTMLAAADVRWRPLPEHQLLFGLEAKQVEVDEASWAFQGFLHPLPPTWMNTDTRRRVISALMQDEFRAGERLSLTATLRYDNYDDVGAYASPRAAAVWRIDDKNILKFQYAQAFRPPTFYELTYSDPDGIDVSQIATYELGYLLKHPAWEARFILFHSDLTGPIVFDELGVGGYTNGPDTTLDGVELEYQHRFGSRIKLDANLSYVDARRQAIDDPLPGGPSLLGNLALLWQATDRWTAALQLRYVGSRDRDAREELPPLNGQTHADLTLNWHAPGRGLQVHLGVKNLLNADIRYPGQFQQFDGVELPYLQDYPRPERRLWLSVGYSF
jgi:iron complex outermembrane receptor protein